jgi:hypothetical protein
MLALPLVLLVGCGQATSTTTTSRPAASSTSTASPSPAPTPTPLYAFPLAAGVKCPDLASLGLERALLNPFSFDRKDVILCDARDTAHPRTLQSLQGSSAQQFLSRDLIGYLAQKGGGPSATSDKFISVVTTLNLTTGEISELASSQGTSWAGAWSPGGSTIAYFTDVGGVHHYWLKRGGAAPIEFSSPIQVLGRGGISDDESLVAFSHDGQYVLVVDTAVSRLQAFRTSDAALVYAAPSGGAGGLRTMAIWAHNADRFYFRNNSGVYQWDASSGISNFIPGLKWSRPALTADDRFVAYMVWISDKPHVETRELSSGAVTTFPLLRDGPVFVGDTTLLVHEEVYCDHCLGAYNWTGKTFVIHTDTRAESDLGITNWQLGPFWPNN